MCSVGGFGGRDWGVFRQSKETARYFPAYCRQASARALAFFQLEHSEPFQVSDTLTRASNGMCLDIPNVDNIELKNGIPLQIYECGEWNAGWVIQHFKNDLHDGWGSWVIDGNSAQKWTINQYY